MTTTNGQFDQVVARAVAIREEIRAAKTRHKEELKPLQERFDKICGGILAYIRKIGVKSMRTEGGTAYVASKNSASLADRQAFKNFVIANERWDLLDWKVNVTAAVAYAEENKALPPGVNLSREVKLGVRSPGQKEGDDDNDE